MRYFLMLAVTVAMSAQQVDLTKNVKGVLTQNHGGTGVSFAPNNTILVGTLGSWALVSLPDCQDTGGNHFNYNAATHSVICGNSSGGGPGGLIAQLTGDATAIGPGIVPITLETVNSGPGVCGDSTHVCQVTVNGKGLTTVGVPVLIVTGFLAPVPATFSAAATVGTLTHSFASVTHSVQCVNASGIPVYPSSIALGSSADTIGFLGGLAASTTCIASR